MNNGSLFTRFIYCLLGWGAVGVIYHYTGQVTEQAHTLFPSKLDNTVPFSPEAIWFYLSFFLFIPMGYFFSPQEKARSLMYAMQLCALVSGAVYLWYPTTMLYHEYDLSTLSGRALSALIDIDSPQNLLPSLHVSLTLVVLNALWSTQQKFRTVLYVIWAIAICTSVLVLKRHLFIDVVTGAITACGALAVVRAVKVRAVKFGLKRKR